MDESAAVSPIAVILVVGIVAAISLGALFAAQEIRDASTPEAVEEREIRAQARGEYYEVGLSSGESIPTDQAFVRYTLNGTTEDIPLTAWEASIGTSLDPGEWICIAGPRLDCLKAAASDMAATLYLGDNLHVYLGPVADFNAADEPPVTYQGRRPSFQIQDDGGIVVQCTTDVNIDVIGVEITNGANGPAIPVYMKSTTTGSTPYIDIFGGQEVDGDMEYDLGLVQEGSILGLWARANGGGFDEQYTSFDDDPHVLVLKDGDQGPEFTPYGNQVAVGELLDPYVDDDGYITLGPAEAIVLFEFNPNLNSAAADFQDLVVLYEFGVAEC